MRPLKSSVLLFDLDDTLIPSTRFYLEARTACGLSQDEYDLARDMVKSRLGRQNPASRNRILYFKTMLENRGEFSSGRLLNLCDEYERNLSSLIDRFIQSTQHQSVLRKLAQNHVLCLITNENTRTQMLKLKQIDPRGEIFSIVVTSEEVGQEKPNSKIFDEVLSKIPKFTQSSEIIMIGDDLEADIAPALSRGWRAFWVREFLKPEISLTSSEGVEMIESICDLPYKI